MGIGVIHFTKVCSGSEAGAHLRLMDLLGPVTRVKKKRLVSVEFGGQRGNLELAWKIPTHTAAMRQSDKRTRGGAYALGWGVVWKIWRFRCWDSVIYI